MTESTTDPTASLPTDHDGSAATDQPADLADQPAEVSTNHLPDQPAPEQAIDDGAGDVSDTDATQAAPDPTSPDPTTVDPMSRPMAAPTTRSLSYAVDIVFCIDVTGSMNPVLDAVKTNALKFYDDVQANLTDKGKHVDELRVRVVAFRDFAVNTENALVESAFFSLPGERMFFDQFVNRLVAEGGGDAPESGLEAVALAITSPWTARGDRRRQVIVVWTDQPAHPLDPTVLPPDLAGSVPADFDALTDLWEDEQGLLGPSSKRLILFAPDGPGWSDISANWENVVHHPSQAGGGLSEVDYSTIIDSIGNSV